MDEHKLRIEDVPVDPAVSQGRVEQAKKALAQPYYYAFPVEITEDSLGCFIRAYGVLWNVRLPDCCVARATKEEAINAMVRLLTRHIKNGIVLTTYSGPTLFTSPVIIIFPENL